jgi:hypothetical protein
MPAHAAVTGWISRSRWRENVIASPHEQEEHDAGPQPHHAGATPGVNTSTTPKIEKRPTATIRAQRACRLGQEPRLQVSPRPCIPPTVRLSAYGRWSRV